MNCETRTENMTPEAVRAKEEFLLYHGAMWQKTLDKAKEPVLFEDKNGEQYIWHDGRYERVEPRKPEKIVKAEPFETFSLNGLLDYILEDPEGRFGEGTRHIVRVKSPTLVEVIAPETGYWRERELVAYCKAGIPEISFGRYMDAEDFQVMVQTCFMESDNRAVVLKLAGSVRKEQNMQTADDGVSQKVTINSGISTAAVSSDGDRNTARNTDVLSGDPGKGAADYQQGLSGTGSGQGKGRAVRREERDDRGPAGTDPGMRQ